MRQAFFHEDDYCQIEILPLNNLAFCLKQAEQIEEFSEKHRAGFGWDAVYVREENPTKLSSLNITLAEARRALTPDMPEYDDVLTGYGSHQEKCKQTFAFGNDKTGTIFMEAADDNVITAIWCSDPMHELQKLPRVEQLLFADWGWKFICPLSDTNRIQTYLLEREQVFRKLSEKWAVERKEREDSEKSKNRKWWKLW